MPKFKVTFKVKLCVYEAICIAFKWLFFECNDGFVDEEFTEWAFNGFIYSYDVHYLERKKTRNGKKFESRQEGHLKIQFIN